MHSLINRLFLIFSFAAGLSFIAFSAVLPPVISFSPEDYLADNQNWSITQSESDHIFIANNKGLLEFNGDSWILYPSPNESIIRSVYYSNGLVYSGCYRDFGYWKRDEFGQMQYSSLIEKLNIETGDNEEFWTIVSYADWMLFQSLDAIYLYNSLTRDLRKLEFEEGITKLIRLGNEVLFSIPRKGIFRISDGSVHLVSDHPVFRENLVNNLYKIDGQILVQTNTAGILTLEENPLKWGGTNANFLSELAVYNSIQTRSGNLLLGTISDGLLKVDNSGEIIYHITMDHSLPNNTVLSVFEDRIGNIWLGLDNGISCVNLNSAVRIFYDRSGKLGTVYASVIFEDKLYLGTNQGLFYKTLNAETADRTFDLVEGSVGQVWDLFVYDEKLFCGHNDGTFLVENSRWTQISDIPGTWCFKPVEGNADILLQGNYKGLSILEKSGGSWRLRNVLSGFNISSRYIEFIDKTSILVAHEYKGVYRIKLDESYLKVEDVEKVTSVDRGLYSSIATFMGDILYSSHKGIWRYDKGRGEFFRDEFLSELYTPSTYSSGKLISTGNKTQLWAFSKGSIHFIAPGKITDELAVTSIPIHYSLRNAMVGYENILEYDQNRYLFGSSQGYFLIDLGEVMNRQLQARLTINRVLARSLNQEEDKILSLSDGFSLKNRYNHLEFSFSVPEFEKYFTTEYQYKLVGLMDIWSPWQAENRVVFNNLDFGNYEFQVRGRVGKNNSSNLATFSFKIERPFYLSNLMILLYFCGTIALMVFVHSAYRAYYKGQREKLEDRARRELDYQESENKRRLMLLNNEKLRQDIESKNRELAISTMSLIKKNKVLNGIKTELNKLKSDSKDLKKVINLINKNLKSSDDWDFFERAFNNADKEFFRKIKAKHPGLTTDDLRLCAYLRLNLSSKEIAPLLGISPKSVEIKRYRLRKKMDLTSEVNLTEYILEV
ncbi:MAG: Y Y Y domain-containing protein [Saprospirales bacterium]|nr:MAG: Y Y Y domain-containing protein [Saprospirales bacterium]